MAIYDIQFTHYTSFSISQFCVARHEQLKDVVPPYFFFLYSDKIQSV